MPVTLVQQCGIKRDAVTALMFYDAASGRGVARLLGLRDTGSKEEVAERIATKLIRTETWNCASSNWFFEARAVYKPSAGAEIEEYEKDGPFPTRDLAVAHGLYVAEKIGVELSNSGIQEGCRHTDGDYQGFDDDEGELRLLQRRKV